MPSYLDGSLENRPRSLASEIVDFTQATGHAALEKPVNGVVQIANKVTGMNLPELNLIGAPEKNSAGAIAGTIVGSAAAYYALSRVGGKALSSLGGASTTGAVIRSAMIGAAYEGVFQPSDMNSQHFFRDRFTSAAVGGATFAAMGGTGLWLDKQGYFAVQAGRSLAGSMTYGALTGIPGGIVHAEANAILKQGRLATMGELAGDTTSYAAFGAAFGAAGWGHSRVSELIRGGPQTVVSGESRITIRTDAEGKPVRFDSRVPAQNDPNSDVKWGGTLRTNGEWKVDYSKELLKGTNTVSGPAGRLEINDVVLKPNGSVQIITPTEVRTFTPGKDYTRYSPFRDGLRQGDKPMTRLSEEGRILEEVDQNGRRSYYRDGNLMESIKPDNSKVTLYRRGDSLDTVGIKTTNNGEASIRRRPNHWEISVKDQNYILDGDVVPVIGPSKQVDAIEFRPKNGTPTRFDVSSDDSTLVRMSNSFAKPDSMSFYDRGTYVKFNDKADVRSLSMRNEGGQSISFESTKTGAWQVTVGERSFTWEGNINPVKNADGSPYQPFEMTPKNGSSIKIPNSADGIKPLLQLIESTGQSQGILSYYSAIRVTPEGQVFVRGGKSELAYVNGQKVNATSEIQIQPGVDRVELVKDVGDRYSIIEKYLVDIKKTADGTAMLNGKGLATGDQLRISVPDNQPAL
jgi:hypothetical protein